MQCESTLFEKDERQHIVINMERNDHLCGHMCENIEDDQPQEQMEGRTAFENLTGLTQIVDNDPWVERTRSGGWRETPFG